MLYIITTFVSPAGNRVRKSFICLIGPNHLADYVRCGMKTKIKYAAVLKFDGIFAL
jgi:hypothetical protein